MPEIAAILPPTLSGISTYVGQLATPNQQSSITVATNGFPSDTFGAITANQLYTNGYPTGKYTSPPTAPLTYSAPYANFVYLIGLRGKGTGNMVYARIDIQAKMRFRQTCYKTLYEPYQYFVVTGTNSKGFQTGYWATGYNVYYQVLENPTTRLYAESTYQIYTVTNNSYSTPGYSFTGGNLKYSSPANLPSGATYSNYGGGFSPFGAYTFRTTALPAGTRYSLFAPSSATTPVAQWDAIDGSYPFNDTFTQISIGMCSPTGGQSPTIDNWNAKDI